MNVEVDEEVCIIQSMADGTNTYLYGNGRIAQVNTTSLMTDYYLGDALGSVRQLTSSTGAITYARAYDPYGVVTATTGASATPYGYTGEYTTNDLVYLRARHYDPAMGRFLTSDPSHLEANLYTYARSNPVRYIDPVGLFSRDEITKSLRYSSFSEVLSATSVYGNWGLIAALLSVLPGDTISGGKLSIGFSYLGTPTTISYAPPAKVGVDSNGDITLNNLPIGNFRYANPEVKLGLYQVTSNFGNFFAPEATTHYGHWRYEGERYYKISSLHGTRTFVDGADKSDYPDFVGASVSATIYGLVGGQDLFMTDRFGRTYIGFAVTGGFTLPVEFSAFEGYVGSFSNHTTRVSEEELFSALVGGPNCLGVNVGLGYGIGVSGCLTSSAVAIYSYGLQAGLSGNFALGTVSIGRNPVYAWDWAIQDQINGIKMRDLLTMPERPYNACSSW